MRPLRPADLLVPGAVTTLGVLELWLVHPDGWLYGAGLEVVAGLLLVWRRRLPLVVCTLAAVIMLWMPWAGPQLDEVATPILTLALICYSLSRWVPDLRGLAALAVIVAVFFADYLWVDDRSHDVSDAVFISALLFPPYAFGRIVRRMDEQRRLLAEQQDLIRDQAVTMERERIARELHDVIAHSVSAMVVQTAAAQDLVRLAPDRAAELLQAVADTGRRTLAETGRLLHLIRDDADELGLSPAPGLADLPRLVAGFREHGLAVDSRLPTSDPGLPGGVDVSAYRMVQELLTNALRYGDGTARLDVSVEEDRLRISCANPVAARPPASGSGLGLRGMQERVSLVGGTLRRSDGDDWFAVEIEAPLTPEVVR